jgi:hypothetical protein
MVIKFTVDVHSLATGKDYRAGQTVPPNFPNIQDLIDGGIAYIAEEPINEEPTIPSKPPTSDSKAITLDMLYLIKAMSYSELSDLLRENELKVSGSKEDKLQRLIDYYEGGGE